MIHDRCFRLVLDGGLPFADMHLHRIGTGTGTGTSYTSWCQRCGGFRFLTTVVPLSFPLGVQYYEMQEVYYLY